MKKTILSIVASVLIMVSCKNNIAKVYQASSTEGNTANSEVFNKRLRDNRYKALNNNNITVARIIFKGLPPDVKADFWKFKLENWRDNAHTPEIEKQAINNLLPKISKELFAVNESDKIYTDFINYIEGNWLNLIQPYINYDRLMLLIASPYYPESPDDFVIVGGGSAGSNGGGVMEECGCNLSRTNDFCNGVPGSGTSGGVGKTCKITNNCVQSAHGCGWLWVMTCKGECK